MTVYYYHMQSCDKMIATRYGDHVERRHLDGVTIEGDKVHLEQYYPREWKAHCDFMPAMVK